ncbi:DMT family transporter [Albidovulum sp.]
MRAPAGRPLAAALWMSGSIAGFSALAVSGRQIGATLDTFEMMLYRSLIGFAVIVATAAATRRWSAISRHDLGLHLLRNLVHFAGQNLWLAALALIPLAQLFAIEFSNPLIVALLAPLLLSERLGAARLGAVALGFAGILMVARPFAAGGLSPGLLIALASAAAFAGTAILTKWLTARVSVLNILFWLSLMQSAFGLICAGIDGDIALPGRDNAGWVVVMGLSGLVAHLSLTKALSLAPATVVMPVDFLRLPVIAVIGMAFYGEALDPWVLAGGAIIFLANWLNIRLESQQVRSRARRGAAPTQRQ